MKKFIFAFLALTIAVPAQERAAGSSLENQVTWTALAAKADAAMLHSKSVEVLTNQIIKCNDKQKLYSPSADEGIKDKEGCINPLPTDLKTINNLLNKIVQCGNDSKILSNGTCKTVNSLASLKTRVISGSMCESYKKNGTNGGADKVDIVSGHKVYTKTVTCPSGWRLLACSGGPGDEDEITEGSFIRPVNNDSCELVVGEAICTPNFYWTKAWVYAHCAKIE